MPIKSDVHISAIWVYPIKSLDGVRRERALIRPKAGLENDREFAIADENGRLVTAKRNVNLHRIETSFSEHNQQVSLRNRDLGIEQDTFDLHLGNERLDEWLSDFLGQRVRLVQDAEVGFPDEAYYSGPTIISDESLQAVSQWFADWGPDEAIRRFRANIVLSTPTAFFEDKLLPDSGPPVPFELGDASLIALAPCIRCAVPTRDSRSGEVVQNFQRTFTFQRGVSLPKFVRESQYDTMYSLSVLTRFVGGETTTLTVGDSLKFDS